MLSEERERLATLFLHVGDFAESGKGGLFFSAGGGMYVEVHPARGVAVIADPEGGPERAAQWNRSVEGAIVADLPGEKREHEPGGYQDGGREPERTPVRNSRQVSCLRFLPYPRRFPEGIDSPSGKNGTERESRGIRQGANAAEDAKSKPTLP